MKNNNAFTLIELLVVVLIIGILAAIAVPKYQIIIKASKFSKIVPIVNSLGESMQRYLATTNLAPLTFDDLDIKLPANTIYSQALNNTEVLLDGGTMVLGIQNALNSTRDRGWVWGYYSDWKAGYPRYEIDMQGKNIFKNCSAGYFAFMPAADIDYNKKICKAAGLY